MLVGEMEKHMRETLDSLSRPLSRSDYLELLDLLIDDLEARKEACEQEEKHAD